MPKNWAQQIVTRNLHAKNAKKYLDSDNTKHSRFLIKRLTDRNLNNETVNIDFTAH